MRPCVSARYATPPRLVTSRPLLPMRYAWTLRDVTQVAEEGNLRAIPPLPPRTTCAPKRSHGYAVT